MVIGDNQIDAAIFAHQGSVVCIDTVIDGQHDIGIETLQNRRRDSVAVVKAVGNRHVEGIGNLFEKPLH